MAVNDFTGKNIQDTYQRVVQTDGTNLANGTGSFLPISFDGNNVIISGSLTATEYIVSSSVSNIQIATLSGSTKFGDSQDDTHLFTGSLSTSGSINMVGVVKQIGITSPIESIPTGGDIVINRIRSYNNGGNNRSGAIRISPGQLIIHPVNLSSTTLFTHGLQFYSGLNGYGVSDNPSINTHEVGDLELKVANNLIVKIEPEGIDLTGHITASGNISASGQLYGQNFLADTSLQVANKRIDYDNTNLRVRDTGLTVDGHITASGNISASGFIQTPELRGVGTTTALEVSGFISASEFRTTGHITASGHISASGDIITTKLRDSAENNHIVFGNNNNTIAISSDDTEIMRLDGDSQRVGINTTTPGEALEVVGNISASGNLIVNSIIGTINGGIF